MSAWNVALETVATVADNNLVPSASVDAFTVAQDLGVGAPRATDTARTVAADQTVILSNAPGALAGVAGLVCAIGTDERGAALPAVGAWCVFNKAAESVAVGTVAAILVEEHAAIALEAVLTVLAGAVLADLAVGNGGVALGRALAAVVDRRFDHEPAVAAGEWLGAPPLELADPGGCLARRAGLVAVALQQIPALATDLATASQHIPGQTRFGKHIKPRVCF